MLRKRLHADAHRTIEQLRNHYEVEREIADRLRRSGRAERTHIMRTMYDELFARVPDHPSCSLGRDPAEARAAAERQWSLLGRRLRQNHVLLEFGPGSCSLAYFACARAHRVIAVDISDQDAGRAERPENFRFVVYDGYDLDLPDGSIDVVYSFHMIEHLHPDDVAHHLRLAHRLLGRKGCYVLSTPHRHYGPWDVSGYFSHVPLGFHLKEWTVSDLALLARQVGFAGWQGYWYARGRCLRLPNPLILSLEKSIGRWPPSVRRKIGRLLLPSATVILDR